MATNPVDDKKRKFSRIAPSAFRLPVPVLPKSRDLRKPSEREEHDAEMEDWRKKLDFGQGGTQGVTVLGGGSGGGVVTPPTIPVPGEKGEKGERGEKGETGLSVLAKVIPFHVYIAKRTDNIPGKGVIIDPYDGSTWEKLDTLLRGFGPNTVIHFGPGVFETRGFVTWPIPAAFRWLLKDGWKLIGSGIDQTTLKLVASTEQTNFAAAIAYSGGTGLVDDVEISDITFDCNIEGQEVPVKVSAIGIFGNRTIIQRIRIKNWGSTMTVFGEPFALSVGVTTPFFGDISGCLIEGVIIEKPTTVAAVTGVASMIGCGGGETSLIWTGATITRTGAVATVAMAGGARHSLAVGSWFCVRGATQTEYNGAFQATEIVSVSSFKYAVTGTPATPATGTPEVEHAPDPNGLGTGMLRNLVIRNCLLDATDSTGIDIHGITIGGVDGAIVESNTIRNMVGPIYMDTFRGESVIYRNNVLQRVATGIVIGLGFDSYRLDTVVIEGNIIELKPLLVVVPDDYVPMVNTVSNEVAINLVGVRTMRPYSFRLVVIRDNIMRLSDGADSTIYTAITVAIQSVETLIMTRNIIGFREPNQLRLFNSIQNVIAYGNRNMDGAIVRTYKVSTGLNYPDPDIELDKAQKLAAIGF